MTARLDITGERYGKLVAVKRVEGSRPTKWLFKCDCKQSKEINLNSVRVGNVKSCGCLAISHMHCKRTHEYDVTRTYKSWQGMKNRCLNNRSSDYERYGARGIGVHKKWINSFSVFLEDMGEAPKGMTLDRIDPKKDYSPKNCRWATRHQQSLNRGPHMGSSSKYKGVSKTKYNTYKSTIKFKDTINRLGSFKSEIEAAKAYDKAAKELQGEFAYLNFPNEV